MSSRMFTNKPGKSSRVLEEIKLPKIRFRKFSNSPESSLGHNLKKFIIHFAIDNIPLYKFYRNQTATLHLMKISENDVIRH